MLLGVQLDDEVLLDGKVDILFKGNSNDLRAEGIRIVLKPLGSLAEGVGLDIVLYLIEALARILERYRHAGFNEERGDIDLAAVNGEMAVKDKLSCLGSGHSKAQSVNDVVKSAFEDGEKVLTGLALSLGGQLEIASELALEKAVISFCLLLFSELRAILRGLAAALAMLAGSVSTALKRALFGKASVALQKKLLILSAAKTANGVGISCHIL